MIDPDKFLDAFLDQRINYFTGVPDSLLASLCASIQNRIPIENHVIAANEGSSIALATGHFISSGNPGLVYMQNSGLGNAVNPLLSLADREVYAIPMVLVIGWRGEPGKKDEPQHVKQGIVTPEMLELMNIPYKVIDADTQDYAEIIRETVNKSLSSSGPMALLVRKGTFKKQQLKQKYQDFELSRENAIRSILDKAMPDTIIVSTTGKTSRELYEHRESKKEGHSKDFLTVGCMGHAISIAMGIASNEKNLDVLCIDGDGSTLMHMGSLAIVGNSKLTNLTHILINNGAHESVGGQPTVAFDVSLTKVAEACGYKYVKSVRGKEDLSQELELMRSLSGPKFIEIRVKMLSRSDLGRPKESPISNRKQLQATIHKLLRSET